MQNDPERIRRALLIAAQIVARDGEAFLPVFLRLEQEVALQEERNAALKRALALVNGESQGGDQRAMRSNARRRPSSAPPSP